MKYFHLLWRNLTRKKVRTTFTFLSVTVAFLLFGLLMAVKTAFEAGVEIAGQERLLTIHKVSLVQLLPFRYLEQIRSVDGVAAVSYSVWFGGVYQDPKNFFAQMAVDPPSFLEVYPEYLVPDDQRQAWLATRTGILVGRKLADRFGWKLGDRIPIQPTIWRPRDGGPETYEFDLVAIYDGAKKGVDETQLFFHYDYLMERMDNIGMVGWYIVQVEDPERADVVAESIDHLFANSPAETKTSTEKAFMQSFAKQVGDTGTILTAIISIVFFVILLIAGNTMAQSVRERIRELGVLKTLGFTDGGLLAMVLGESLLLSCLAAALGLGLFTLAMPGLQPMVQAFLPVFYVPPRGYLLGAACALLLGIVAGLLPALRAQRLQIVEALRRV